jgi:hypothetical protein
MVAVLHDGFMGLPWDTVSCYISVRAANCE